MQAFALPKDCPRFLRRVFAAAASGVVLAGLLNVAVDPLGVFGTPTLAGFNERKPYLSHDRELARWARAERFCGARRGPTIGIFGNSRAEIGFDPDSAAFKPGGYRVFNHAIPGMPLTTPANQLRWLEAANCLPDRVILGIDFHDFLGGPELPEGILEAVPPRVDAAFLASSVFSLQGVGDAVRTVAIQHMPDAASITNAGFNPLLEYPAEVARLGHYRLFQQRAEENRRRWAVRKMRLTTPSGKPSREFAALADFLSRARRRGIQVDLVVYPVHVQTRTLVAQLGAQPVYEDWLRRMAVLDAPGLPQNTADAAVRVWNFASVTPATSEAIPPPGDRTTRMENYWEAGHFKPKLGDAVLARLLSPAAASVDGEAAEGFSTSLFGMRLTPASVEGIIRADRAALQPHLPETVTLPP